MSGLLLAGCLLPAGAVAQDRSATDDLKTVFDDAWSIVSAPAHAPAEDWHTAGLAAGAFGALLLIDEPVQEWLRANPRSLIARGFRRFGEDSPINLLGRTAQFLLPMSTALYVAGHMIESDGLKDAGIGCATTNLTTTATRAFSALLLGRLRPRYDGGAFVFEPIAFGGWDMRSFPGGHAANAMSCASYFNRRFDLGPAGPLIYATAVAIGAGRVVDEAHWTSDTFAGMAHGTAVGKGVAGRFLRRDAERQYEASQQPGLYFGWTITF